MFAPARDSGACAVGVLAARIYVYSTYGRIYQIPRSTGTAFCCLTAKGSAACLSKWHKRTEDYGRQVLPLNYRRPGYITIPALSRALRYVPFTPRRFLQPLPLPRCLTFAHRNGQVKKRC